MQSSIKLIAENLDGKYRRRFQYYVLQSCYPELKTHKSTVSIIQLENFVIEMLFLFFHSQRNTNSTSLFSQAQLNLVKPKCVRNIFLLIDQCLMKEHELMRQREWKKNHNRLIKRLHTACRHTFP